MKTLLITTAIIAATGFGAYAQDTSASSGTTAPAAATAPAAGSDTTVSADASMGANFKSMMEPGEIQASKLIGMDVYSTNGKPVPASANGQPDGWQDIGEVGDIVLTKDGKVDAVLVDVGGFLGMGEHRVGLSMSGIKMVDDTKTKDDTTDFFLVVDQSKDSLKAAPEYKTPEEQKQAAASSTTTAPAADSAATTATASNDTSGAMSSGSAPAPAATTTADSSSTATAPAADSSTTTAAADTGSAPMAGASAQKDGYAKVDSATITAQNLKDADVYGAKDSKIGSVSKLILDPQGKIQQAVVDVGGFLGIGSKSVALTPDQMQIMKKQDGKDLRVYVSMTEDQLKAMPAYKG